MWNKQVFDAGYVGRDVSVYVACQRLACPSLSLPIHSGASPCWLQDADWPPETNSRERESGFSIAINHV